MRNRLTEEPTEREKLARLALGKLAGRMTLENDKRQYGVNCACLVLEGIQAGQTIEEAVFAIASVRVVPDEDGGL